MFARVLLKILIFLGAAVFAYSLLVVGVRGVDSMQILGGVISLILAISALISFFFDFRR